MFIAYLKYTSIISLIHSKVQKVTHVQGSVNASTSNAACWNDRITKIIAKQEGKQ